MSEFHVSGDLVEGGATEPPAPNLPAPAVYDQRTVENYRPEQDLLDGRAMRSAVVRALTQTGVPVNDKNQMHLLLAAIKDQDSQALGLIRAKVDSGAADQAAELKQAAQAMIEAARAMKNTAAPVIDVAARVIPTLDETALDPEDNRPFVEGELGTGVSTETFDGFRRRMGGEVKLADEDEEE